MSANQDLEIKCILWMLNSQVIRQIIMYCIVEMQSPLVIQE